MLKSLVIFCFLLVHLTAFCQEQVRIRLFSNPETELAVFTVLSGKYEINTFTGEPGVAEPGEIIIVTIYGNSLYLKLRNREPLVCDSLYFTGITVGDSFSLRVKGTLRNYSGDLHCLHDLGSLVLINLTDIEAYVAGVVLAEGGSGKNTEYFKTQSVIVRTYMYRYFDKHASDHFNLCDNTHCQVFNGITTDTIILKAALATKGEVILGPDSSLIIAAFHSNCGGETAPSEAVWLTEEPYLKKVTDPFCTASRNAKWQMVMSRDAWTAYFEKMGYSGDIDSPALLNFSQKNRLAEFRSGDFSLPLRQLRADLNLRSSFFSVTASADSVTISGRGYGHGVGLCQEGAMSMAMKGFDYRQIINFYYSGVIIADISEAVKKE